MSPDLKRLSVRYSLGWMIPTRESSRFCHWRHVKPLLEFSARHTINAVFCCFSTANAQVRLGPSRRMLHGNGDRGVWLERHRQTENRVPLLSM